MRTRDITLFSRRAVLAGLVVVPTLGLAHEGHGPARVGVEVEVLRVKNEVVTLRFSLVNTSSTPVALQSVTTQGAAPVVLSEPFEVGGFGVGEIRVDLVFSGMVPAAFTSKLNFGHHGVRSITVKL